MFDGSYDVQVAVVVPARNESGRIGHCLQSIKQALLQAGLTGEIIVVDDNSDDDTAAEARIHGATVLSQPTRGGPLNALARGVEQSKAPLLFFVDADCRIDASAFGAIVPHFMRAEVGVVAARSVPQSSTTMVQKVLRHRGPTRRSTVGSAAVLHELRLRLQSHEMVPIGRLMALRRTAWAGLERLTSPCDRSVAKTAIADGYIIAYEPGAIVYYEPLTKYSQLRADFVRTRLSIRQAGDVRTEWNHIPPREALLAIASAARKQPLDVACWTICQSALWTEAALGRLSARNASFDRWEDLNAPTTNQDQVDVRPHKTHG